MDRVLVGTAGHIDHGKSALVKALTGTDPDRLPEEKERGITIELGFAHASWDGVVFSFVDVPGHEKFVRTMVAGATGIDVALLVVASDDAVMPQTREHLAILSLLGVGTGLVARTKSDLVDDEMGALVDEEVAELVRGTFLEGSPIVPVSAVTGAGLDDLREALVEAARRAVPRDPERSPARLFLDRAFAVKGFGPVVTGTLAGGRVKAEDRLLLFSGKPEGKEVRVRRVEVHGEERKEARAGERTSLNLAGVEVADLGRGMTLAAPGTVVPSSLLTVEATLLSSAPPLAHGARLRLHHGTSDVPARLVLLAPPEGVEPPKTWLGGETLLVQLLCRERVPALRGDHFVLRRPSPVETLGGGRVLDPGRPRIKRRAPLSAHAAKVLAGGTDDEFTSLLLAEAGPAGLDAPALAARLGGTRARAAALLDAAATAGRAIRIAAGSAGGGNTYADPSAAQEMLVRAKGLFAARRRSGSPSLLVPRGEFVEKFGRGLSPAAVEGWLALLAKGKELVLDADLVGPPGSRAADVAEPLSDFAEKVAEAWKAAGFDPPRSFEVAKTLGTKPQVVDGLVAHLLKTGVILRLSPEVAVHRDAVAGAEAKLEGVKGKTMSVADFRDLLGLSRKTLIPLLEHFDAKRKTRRQGDARLVL